VIGAGFFSLEKHMDHFENSIQGDPIREPGLSRSISLLIRTAHPVFPKNRSSIAFFP
jgi:hypothetical protein